MLRLTNASQVDNLYGAVALIAVIRDLIGASAGDLADVSKAGADGMVLILGCAQHATEAGAAALTEMEKRLEEAGRQDRALHEAEYLRGFQNGVAHGREADRQGREDVTSAVAALLQEAANRAGGGSAPVPKLTEAAPDGSLRPDGKQASA